MHKNLSRFCAVLTALFAGPLFAPQLLAFPYQAQVGADRVWSVTPIARPQLDKILLDAAARTATSPLVRGAEHRDIFITDGGWRWLWLANIANGAFALSRAITDNIIINDTDIASGTVNNGSGIGSKRSLAGIVAHEKCHGMVRRQFGLLVDFTKPQWLREGYCDFVAGEGSLTPADVAFLQAKGQAHPALPYYFGRQRVAAALAANHGDIEKLFAETR